ncbi:MAG TPA: universal stress protein [Rectinemataceae bacterium]|nr:universal stress protein [Rectinemataceae bacterium]
MFEKILLAVDGSDHALNAATVAGNLARSEPSTALRVLTVYETVPKYLGQKEQESIIAAHMRESERILAEARARIGKTPCAVETEVLSGPPAETIIEAALDQKADLVVMGSRGLGLLAGLLLGSQSQKVATHAPCPVLIVR